MRAKFFLFCSRQVAQSLFDPLATWNINTTERRSGYHDVKDTNGKETANGVDVTQYGLSLSQSLQLFCNIAE